MSARDDYPLALFMVNDEPDPGRKFEHGVFRDICGMFDELDRLRAEMLSLTMKLDHYEGWFGSDCRCDGPCPL